MSLSFAAPAAPASGVEYPHLNLTSPLIGPNEVSLAQNVNKLLQGLHESEDRTLSTAPLVNVFLYASAPAAATINVHDLRQIEVVLHPRTGQPSPGFRDIVKIRNDPVRWDHWLSPHHSVVREGVWELDNEIQWPEVQSLMSIDEADLLVKAAGYHDRFWKVEIGQFTDQPLGYCFFFRLSLMF
ncbi:MAG: hypothetical protein Q9220_000004 [cf. Caloplaca sp. 1 TL-2023]